MPIRIIRIALFSVVAFAGCQEIDYASLHGQDTENTGFTSLPYQISDADFQPLWSRVNQPLEEKLTAAMMTIPKWKKMIQDKKMAVGIVDLSDPYNIRYAAVNGDEMMYAASLPKIAILLAAVDAFDKHEIPECPENLTALNSMISRSNNAAATYFIDLLGYDKIENVLEDPRYDLYDQSHGGGLWVGKRYAAAGPRHPDPMMGLSHAATVSQVCRFYYLMAMGRLVSPERSKQMLSLMVDPALHHKFVNTLDKIAPGAKLYRKSGTWKDYHCDSVLVWGPGWRRYILVGLVEDPDGEAIMRSLVGPVEGVLRAQL